MKFGSIRASGQVVATGSISSNTTTLLTGSSQLTNLGYSTTGSNLFKGDQTFSGSLIPSVNGVYDLGDPTHEFRHLYLSSASLYIDGTKVLGSTTQELQITTDTGQSFKILEAGSDTITLQSNDGNITLATSGGGDVIMDPTNGVIALKGTTTIYSGFKIVSSDGNNIQLGDGLTVTGSIVSTTTPLVSGSSQITYGGLSGIPSGIISGSSQISGFGLATTGSNTFNGNQTVNGSLSVTGNLVAQQYIVSSSVSYITESFASGSHKFGDSSDDYHDFTGSLRVAGSVSIDGSASSIKSGNELRFYRADNGIYTKIYDAGSLAANGFTLDNTNAEGFHFKNNGTTIMRMPSNNYVGIGTTSPNVKLEVLDTATSSGEVARFQRNVDQINEYVYLKVGNSSYPAYFGSMLGTYDIAYMSMSPNPTDGKALCIRTTDGNVGVGITNPPAKLTVQSAGATGILLEQDTSNSGVSARLVARNSSVTGTIRYDNGGWRFNTNATLDSTSGTERALISTDGYFRMLSGTGGIQFGGDTAAANALDDYEEGTWTPTIPGLVTSTMNASYVKIGALVHVMATMAYVSGTGSGNVISGLPFSAAGSHRSGVSFGNVSGVSWGSGATAPFGFVYNTQIACYGFVNNTPYATADFSTFGSGDFIEFSAVYNVL